MKNLFLSLFIGVLILSCGTENKPIYTLTTTVSPSEGGTINPSSGEFPEGEVVTLTGTPTSDGWRFLRWEGDWSGQTNPSTLTITRNYTVIGVFERKNYSLNLTIVGEGTVEERVVQQKSTEYPYETVVELTPIPSEGWRFVSWGGDLSGDEVPKVISVTNERNVTVTFERKNYPLTITVVGEGTVTETIVPQKTTEYPYETVVQLTPVPSEGWFFWNYRGDLNWNEVPQMIVVDEEKNVTVTFIRKGTINELLIYSYDFKNNLIEDILYNSNGSVIDRWTYTYDSNNYLIERIIYNSNGSVEERLTILYDSNNNPIERIRYLSDGSIWFRDTYTYDSNNNLIELIEYNSSGSISGRRTYSYNSNNNLIEQIMYGSDGSIYFRTTYSYDSNNNRIEQITYNSSGIVSRRWTYSYDSNNNLIEQISYDSSGSVIDRTTYSYDSKNNRTERILFRSDGSIFRNSYTYDSNNNLIEQIWYDSNGSISRRWTYSYDSQNNRIERFQYNSVSNKSIPTIHTDPFRELEGFILEPHREFPLYPHHKR